MGSSCDEIVSVASDLLGFQGVEVSSATVIQNLWAGYGQIARVETDSETLIVKHIKPPASKTHTADEGHHRKMISYEVEQYFYSQLAPHLNQDAAVAKCFCSINKRSESSTKVALVLEDLRQRFPVAGEKRGELNPIQVHAALKWLAAFHGHFWANSKHLSREDMRRPPMEEINLAGSRTGVWLNGGYTYLATRQTEYKSLAHDSSEWSEALCRPVSGSTQSIAELVARILSPSPQHEDYSTAKYKTLIHGDVKSENLFTTEDGTAVAFFDFQYVGLGLGVSDLAKLLTCSVSVDMLTSEELGMVAAEAIDMGEGERRLLEYYRAAIEEKSGKSYPWEVFRRHWETALVDWLRFQSSWSFWGNTEWLEARVRHILKDESWLQWVLTSVAEKQAA